MTLRSRLAPTPSGLLHIGNGLNFVITWVLVRRAKGLLRLRIDDADGQRCRPQFLEDIFNQLHWLGLDWDEGPEGVAEFQRSYSQQLRSDQYRLLLGRLQQQGQAYACRCSRKQVVARAGSSIYPGFCRQKGLEDDGQAAIRLTVPQGTEVDVADHRVPLAAMMGDFILWRRDNSPAYQLASLADDLLDDINFIVRGEDLLASSAAQLFLARCLGEEKFCQAQFIHHELLTSAAGHKLSKSDQALSLQAMRHSGARPSAVFQAAAPYLDRDPQQVMTLKDLL